MADDDRHRPDHVRVSAVVHRAARTRARAGPVATRAAVRAGGRTHGDYYAGAVHPRRRAALAHEPAADRGRHLRAGGVAHEEHAADDWRRHGRAVGVAGCADGGEVTHVPQRGTAANKPVRVYGRSATSIVTYLHDQTSSEDYDLMSFQN